MSSSRLLFVLTFEAKDSAFESASPSRLPKMLVENQPSTLSARVLNAGARTLFIIVCPVLPSFPAIGTPHLSANSISAGMSAATDGVKFP